MGGVTHSLDSGIHYTLFHHTCGLLDQERKNSARISPLEGVADVMFKRGTGFTICIFVLKLYNKHVLFECLVQMKFPVSALILGKLE